MPLLPSCLMPEIYAPWKLQSGFVLERVRRVADGGFYRSVEIGTLEPEDRFAIGRICRDNDLRLTCWITDVLEASGLDICAVDEEVRARSVGAVLEQIKQIAEAGAHAISMVSGKDPGADLREAGYNSAFKSISAIAEEAEKYGLYVLIEPLDRFAHKKRLIGPIDEAVGLFGRVSRYHANVGLAFDTAHSALNGEIVLDAMAQASTHIGNLHLSNAVLDSADPLYGDHHMRPGEPGFLTMERAVEILKHAFEIASATGRSIPVAIETRSLPSDSEEEVAVLADGYLTEAFRRAL